MVNVGFESGTRTDRVIEAVEPGGGRAHQNAQPPGGAMGAVMLLHGLVSISGSCAAGESLGIGPI